MKNYYEILGLQNNATDEEIKSAFRKLSLKFHPDKNQGDSFFEGWTKKINEAYEILGNKDKKKAYDEMLKSKSSAKSSETNSKNPYSSDRSSTSEFEVLKQIEEFTPEFLKRQYTYLIAKLKYENITKRDIPNKFSAGRVLIIFILFIASIIGIKKTYFDEGLAALYTTTFSDSVSSNPTIEDIIGEPIKDIGNSILFTSFPGIEDDNEVIAVPIAIYFDGKYYTPPTCEDEFYQQKDVEECEEAKNILLPSVSSGEVLYLLNNGKKSDRIKVLGTKRFGYNSSKTYSALIKKKPEHYIITDNPKIGTNKLTTIKDRPTIPKRKDPEDNIIIDKLLTKVDIDGDGMPELIYECPTYDGLFYTIYSNLNGKWIKVYEGGYQGL